MRPWKIEKVTKRAFAAFLVLFFAAIQSALASGAVRVIIRDAHNDLPLIGAHVHLVGPRSAENVTDDHGVAEFFDVPQGTYRARATKPQFNELISQDFDVDGEHSVDLKLKLVASLKVIGKVIARPSERIDRTDIAEDSYRSQMSTDVNEALAKVAGIGLDSADGLSNITLHNASLGPGGVTINGSRLGGPATALASTVLAGLFTAASVDFNPTYASPSGGVDFRTLQPTKDLQYRLAVAGGSFSRSTYMTAMSGTVGKIGYALQRSFRGDEDPLSGSAFVDQSGFLNYHSGGEKSVSNLIKLRLTASNTTSVSYTSLSGQRSQDLLCTADLTAVPCGFGPNNSRTLAVRSDGLNVLTSLGHIGASLDYTRSRTYSDTNELNRTFESLPSPLRNRSQYHGTAINLVLSATSGRLTHSVSFNNNEGSLDYADTQPGIDPFRSLAKRSEIAVSLVESYKSVRGSTLSFSGSIGDSPQAGSSRQGSLAFSRSNAQGLDLSLNVGMGMSAPSLSIVRPVLGDLASVSFICDAGETIIVSGSAAPQPSSYDSASVNLRRRSAHGDYSINMYAREERGQSSIKYLPISAVDDAAFPGGRDAYLAALGKAWSSADECPGSQYNVSKVYALQSGPGGTLVYQGADINARRFLGRNVSAFASASVNAASFSTLSSQLTGPQSFQFVWQQMPRRPLYRGSLTFDTINPHGRYESLLNFQYTGINNFQNAPANVVTSVALIKQLMRGSIKININNLFDVQSGKMTTYRGINRFTTRSGSQFAYETLPLAPLTVSVTYDVRGTFKALRSSSR